MFTKIRFDEFESEIVFEINGAIVAKVPASWVQSRKATTAFNVLSAIDAMNCDIEGRYSLEDITVVVAKTHTMVGNVNVSREDYPRMTVALDNYHHQLMPALPSEFDTCALARSRSDPKIIVIEQIGKDDTSRLIRVDELDVDDMIESAQAAVASKPESWSYTSKKPNSVCYARYIPVPSLPKVITALAKAKSILAGAPAVTAVTATAVTATAVAPAPAPAVTTPVVTPKVVTASLDSSGNLRIYEDGINIVASSIPLGTIKGLYKAFQTMPGARSHFDLTCCGRVDVHWRIGGEIDIIPASPRCHFNYSIAAKHVDAVSKAITEYFDA